MRKCWEWWLMSLILVLGRQRQVHLYYRVWGQPGLGSKFQATRLHSEIGVGMAQLIVFFWLKTYCLEPLRHGASLWCDVFNCAVLVWQLPEWWSGTLRLTMGVFGRKGKSHLWWLIVDVSLTASEEGTSTKELPPSEWPVAMSMGCFLFFALIDTGRSAIVGGTIPRQAGLYYRGKSWSWAWE